jgi:hypothetical protein
MSERQRAADQQTADTKIMQTVNAAQRIVFADKYPTQVEHSLRLVMERLQAGLDKRDNVDINRVETWRITPVEIDALARAAYHLNEIRRGF